MRPVRPHLRQVEFSVWETGVSKLSHTEIQILKMSDRVVYIQYYLYISATLKPVRIGKISPKSDILGK